MQDIIPSDGRVNNISAVGVEEDGDVYPWTLQGSEHAKMAVCIDRSGVLCAAKGGPTRLQDATAVYVGSKLQSTGQICASSAATMIES